MEASVADSESETEKQSPFKIGDQVTWTDNAPSTWRFIWTPGPMTVVSSRYTDGTPSEYAAKYYVPLDFKPGWLICVEYDADSTNYYDPPLSILLGQKRIRKDIHEMWLQPL